MGYDNCMEIMVSIDDDLAQQASDIARRRDMTLPALVHDLLVSVTQSGATDTTAAMHRLEQSFSECRLHLGPRTWSRDDLYDR